MPKKEEPKKPSQEELQELAMQYEMLRQEITNIDSQVRELQLRHQEIEALRDGITGVNESGSDELLVPIGAGVYIKTKLSDKSTCLINVGANVIIEKPINESIELVNKQLDNIMNAIVKLNDNAEQIIAQLMAIEPVLAQVS